MLRGEATCCVVGLRAAGSAACCSGSDETGCGAQKPLPRKMAISISSTAASSRTVRNTRRIAAVFARGDYLDRRALDDLLNEVAGEVARGYSRPHD